jgi:hypothetical protein
MKLFAFITAKSWRIEVKASNPRAGYNKLKSIPMLNNYFVKPGVDCGNITTSYYEYDKKGIAANYNIKTLKELKK